MANTRPRCCFSSILLCRGDLDLDLDQDRRVLDIDRILTALSHSRLPAFRRGKGECDLDLEPERDGDRSLRLPREREWDWDGVLERDLDEDRSVEWSLMERRPFGRPRVTSGLDGSEGCAMRGAGACFAWAACASLRAFTRVGGVGARGFPGGLDGSSVVVTGAVTEGFEGIPLASLLGAILTRVVGVDPDDGARGVWEEGRGGVVVKPLRGWDRPGASRLFARRFRSSNTFITALSLDPSPSRTTFNWSCAWFCEVTWMTAPAAY